MKIDNFLITLFSLLHMKIIIPAAGYATRLYPLTKDKPKALLEIGSKPMIDHILSKIKDLNFDQIIIVTNHKFAKNFEEWAETRKDLPIKVIDDQTTSNEDRLGAIGDIQFAIEKANIDDEIFILAGDNLFECNMSGFYALGKKKNVSIVGIYDVKDTEFAKQLGIVEINESNQVIEFVEKPEIPKSTLAATMMYYFPKDVVPMIKQYLDEGNKPDRMGDFTAWLHKKVLVYAYFIDGWTDIGDPTQLEEARKKFI